MVFCYSTGVSANGADVDEGGFVVLVRVVVLAGHFGGAFWRVRPLWLRHRGQSLLPLKEGAWLASPSRGRGRGCRVEYVG